MNDEQPATPQPAEPVWPSRKDAEQWYANIAFDYAKAPVGSRDWTLFLQGWAGAIQFMQQAATPQQPAAASAGASEDTAKCPGESALPTPTEMAERMRRVARGFACPLCGWNRPHEHSPEEIIIYRNGVKYGRSGFAWTGADDQGIAEVARPDATAVGGEVRDGADEHHEHRAWQSSVDGPILEIHRRSAGLRGEDSVRSGAALQSPPVATGPCKDCDVVGGCPEYCYCGDFSPVATAQQSEADCPRCKGSEVAGFQRGIRCATCNGSGHVTPAAGEAPVHYSFCCYSCNHEWENVTPEDDCPNCGTTNNFCAENAAASPCPFEACPYPVTCDRGECRAAGEATERGAP